ncbi:MAG: FG-GAP repeat protein [Rickettsiales bacterium]
MRKYFYLKDLDGSNGFLMRGLKNSLGLSSLKAAVDINGDGIDDIVFGSVYPLDGAGQSYVVFGQDSASPSPSSYPSSGGNNEGDKSLGITIGIAVSAIVAVGIGISCYAWRKQ